MHQVILKLLLITVVVISCGALNGCGQTQKTVDAVQIDHVYFTIHGTNVELIRPNTAKSEWQVLHFNDRPVRDHRANSDFVFKILDLAKAQNPSLTSTAIPWLVIKTSATAPKQVEHSTKTINIADTTGALAKTFAERTALDLRDRTITSFDIDDVMDFKSKGKCKNLDFFRDGDRWTGKQVPNLEVWLKNALAIKYSINSDSETDDQRYSRESIPSCTIELKGLHGKKETLTWYREQNTKKWLVTNSALPSQYLVNDAKVLGL